MNPNSCSCHKCQSACSRKPGWFKPGEIEKVAIFKDITLQQLFDSYLGVDWWEADEPGFVIAPAITSMTPGDMYPGNPNGCCVFFIDGKCSIHPVKPFECAEYQHDQTGEEVSTRHEQVYQSWKDHQGQICELLGREPRAEQWSGGWFGGLFGTSAWRDEE